ncbi:MAG: hypothetical protein ACI9F1_002158, partial [Colwellia sp.]
VEAKTLLVVIITSKVNRVVSNKAFLFFITGSLISY